MSISVINGYLCYDSCDAAKAKRGVDPHPNDGADGVESDKNGDGARDGSSPLEGPAVTFGGALSSIASANAIAADAVAASSAATGTVAATANAFNSVDLLV
jgi:hypothetical protein